MYRKIIICATMAFSPGMAVGQMPPAAPKAPIASIPAVKTLVALAKENNPGFAAAKLRTHAERTKMGPAGAMPDPQLSFLVQKAPERHVSIMDAEGMNSHSLSGLLPGMTEYSMSLGQEILWPGKRAAKENMAIQDAKMGEVGEQGAALALESGILAACLELMATKARQELIVSQLGYWASAEAIVKARLDQGGSGAFEAIQAMQEQSRLKLRALGLEKQAIDQCDRINELAARTQNTPIEIEADILGLPLPEPLGAEEIAADLKNRNPEWLASSVAIKGADASLNMAKLERFPDFMVGAGVSKASGMPVGWMLEAGVSIPLWASRKQGREVAKAQSMRGAAGSEQMGLALALEAASRERARSWKLAYDTAKLYEKELIPQGEAALEILIARFQNGGAAFGEMVDALGELLKDREMRLDAIAQTHSIAILQHGAMLSK